jgi:signal transduction histidine kinase
MSRVVQRRALYLAPLLVLAAVLDVLDTFGVSWDDYAILAALVVSAEAGRRLVERTRDPQRQALIFEAFFAAEIVVIVFATWWMSFTRWLGPTALLLELSFANIALPRAAAIRVTTLGIALYVMVVWAETLGWVRVNTSFGLPSNLGQTQQAIIATAAAIILLAFGAFAQREFAAILRRQEASAQQQRQMELLGRMAASVAHDVNNVLTVVSLTTETVVDPSADRATMDASADDLRMATARGKALVRQLLDYARSGQSSDATTDAVAAIQRVAPMLKRLAAGRAEVEVHVPTEPLCVPLDETRLEQVVVNLVVNALDAANGQLRVSVDVRRWSASDAEPRILLENAQPPSQEWRENLALPRGVCVSVSDNGTGIPPEVFSRVLEPFVSTKPEGKGTGLGLATVHTIAQGAGGGVHLASSPGVGTRVAVYLPLATS